MCQISPFLSGREEMLRVFPAVQKQIVKRGIEQKAHEHAKNMEKTRRAYTVEVEGGWIKNKKEKRLIHGSALFSKLDDAAGFYTYLQVKIAELLDQEGRSRTSVKETS